MRKKSIWLILTAAVALGSFSAGCTESLAEEEVIIEQMPEEMMGLSEDIPEIPEISDAPQTAPGEEETDESEAAPAEWTAEQDHRGITGGRNGCPGKRSRTKYVCGIRRRKQRRDGLYIP